MSSGWYNTHMNTVTYTIQTLTNTIKAIKAVCDEVDELHIEEVNEQEYQDYMALVREYMWARAALRRLEGPIGRAEARFVAAMGTDPMGTKWRSREG